MIKQSFKNRYTRSIIEGLDDILKTIDTIYPELYIETSQIESIVLSTLTKIGQSGITDDARIIEINSDKCTVIKNSRNRIFKRLYDGFINDIKNYKNGAGFKDGIIKQLDHDEIEEKIQQMEEWKSNSSMGKRYTKNGSTHLVDYPFFSTLSDKKKKKYYEVDVEYNVSRLCLTEPYKSEYVRSLPSFEGFFTGDKLHFDNQSLNYDVIIDELKKGNYSLELKPAFLKEADKIEQKDFIPSKSFVEIIQRAKSKGNFVFDVRCSNLLQHFTTRTRAQILYNIRNGIHEEITLSGTVNELSAIMEPSAAIMNTDFSNAFYTERVITYLYNMASFRPEKVTNTSYQSMSLIDKLNFHAVTKESGNQELHYELSIGNTILSRMFHNKINYVLTLQMNRLTSGHAQILLPKLQDDRLNDILIGKDARIYKLTDLYRISSATGTKKEQFKKYKDAFLELKNECVLVSEAEFDNTNLNIIVKWLPLTPEEAKDLDAVSSEEIDQKVIEYISSIIAD